MQFQQPQYLETFFIRPDRFLKPFRSKIAIVVVRNPSGRGCSNSYNDVKRVANVKLEIHKKYGEQEYDQTIVTITDSKGLNILYKGNLVHYKDEFTFHKNFKKVTGN